RISEGTIYNLSAYIVDEIITSAQEGDKILFGNVLLTIVFLEIGVLDVVENFVWEYLEEDRSSTKIFEKYTCDNMMPVHKARLEK
ncbi:hypothetical protein KI387_021259, partial [Taxus chinensis]